MSVSTFLQGVTTRIQAWAGDALHFIEGGASVAWSVLLPLLESLSPIAWAQALPIIVQAIEDISTGNLVDIETSVLNKAQALGVTVLKDLESDVLQAIIAVVKAFGPKSAAPTKTS